MPRIDLERSGRVLVEQFVRKTLARLPISPLALTLSGTAFSLGAAAVLAAGHLRWGAGLLLLASACDALDGALARVTGRQSEVGAFIDATMDRYSEMTIGLGLLVYLLQWGMWPDLLLLYLFLSGSFVFSYARARAQAEGFRGQGGLFTRMIRVLVLATGLLAGQLHITLWVLAVGVQVSALHRLLAVCLEARQGVAPQLESPWSRWFRDHLERRALRK